MVGNAFIQVHVQSPTVTVCRRVPTSSIIFSQRISHRSPVEDAGKMYQRGVSGARAELLFCSNQTI